MAAKRSTKKSTPKKSAKKASPKKAKAAPKKAAGAKKAKAAAKPAKKAAPARKAVPAKKAAPAKKAPAPPKAAKPPAPPKAATTASKSRFVWVDLMTKDPAAAQGFYKTLLGWSSREVDMGGGNKYTIFAANGDDFGGVMALPMPEAPVHWLPYVSVEDVDQVTKRAEALGGKVLMGATDIPNVGRFSVIQDPTGGVVSPMSFTQALRPQPAQGLVGPVAWEELITSDTGKAGAFYQDLFGWGRTEQKMGPDYTYHIFKTGDRDAGGMGAMMPALGNTAWVTYFAVDDVDGKTRAATAAGAKQLVPPSDIPNVGRFSWLSDPQGAVFALFKGSM